MSLDTRSMRRRKSLKPSDIINKSTPTRLQKDPALALEIDDENNVSPSKKPQSVKRNVRRACRVEVPVIPTAMDTEPEAEVEAETTDSYETALPFPSVLDATSGYTLQHIVRAHSVNNLGDSDEKTQVWYSAFEPSTTDASSHILATCGGRTICFIDCDIGKVVAKYTHLEEIEEFYCLAWTRVSANEREDSERCHVVAAAGRLATVRLINTVQQTCYAYLRGHSQSVRMVKFSRRNQRHLFSASDDKTIRLWDIGSMNTSEGKHDSACLGIFSADDKIYSMCFSFTEDTLLCGTHRGMIHRFDVRKASSDRSSRESSPNENQDPDEDADRTIRPEETYSNTSNISSSTPWHDTALDDMECIRFPSSKNSDSECWITKSVDGKVLCWKNAKAGRRQSASRPIGEVILSISNELEEKSFMRFSVASNRQETALLVGNDEGDIMIYSIGESLRQSVQGDDPVMPNKTLAHEQSDGCIRRVCLSHDHSTIVAVDHKNRVFIWRRDELS